MQTTDLTTDSLAMPLMAPAQALKHIVHNEALIVLDALCQIAIIALNLISPPANPSQGQIYHVGDGGTDAWSGKSGKLAQWTAGGWRFHEPRPGWVAYIISDSQMRYFDGADWTALEPEAAAPMSNPDTLGVNTQADPTNRLSVKSDAVLLSHDDVTPGSGDMRLNLNKASEADTTSLLMQTNYSGRAEFGLSGQDDFSVKVSADGSNWTEALRADAATGQITLPETPPRASAFNLFTDGGRFGGAPEPAPLSSPAFVQPSYIATRNGTTFSAGPAYFTNSATFGGGQAALDPEVEALITKLRTDGFARRFGIEFNTMRITVGMGTSGQTQIGGDTFVRAVQHDALSIPDWLTLTLNIRVLSGGAVFYTPPGSELYYDGVRIDAATDIRPADGWIQVMRVVNIDPDIQVAYDTEIFRLNAIAGSELLVALPSARPGLERPKPGQFRDYVMSAAAWA